MMMTSSSFTAGAPLPDDVACAIGTCVAAMAQLRRLVMCDLSLNVMKTLADRTQPLEDLIVFSPSGVNWVSVSVFCQCAHNTVLLAAVCSVGWLVSSDYCPIHYHWYCSTSDVVM